MHDGPRLAAWDVVDPVGRHAVGSGNDVVEIIDDHEGPPVASDQGVGTVEAGAIRVHSALEGTPGGYFNQ